MKTLKTRKIPEVHFGPFIFLNVSIWYHLCVVFLRAPKRESRVNRLLSIMCNALILMETIYRQVC